MEASCFCIQSSYSYGGEICPDRKRVAYSNMGVRAFQQLSQLFCVETDHKPLVTLLGTKNLDELPAIMQRFRLRLMRFTYIVSYVLRKDLILVDTLI